ncbi:ABC transporter permease [Paenibacillus sp. GCM10023248]|uniref:ABC transporter permease n=1 Tax=Bacillales TaxID=1385 RepID=UPI002378810D|nr:MULTISPECIES: ABC transporter permease [Bacillales]MDD9269029.1 ABC transporter permease [Paenibacillus sp. MAHUQ-63]MDR6884972.1 peptide/nickel transport system permease protein [Bacillus sp. 3255]
MEILIRRGFGLIGLLFAVSAISFMLVHLSPIDPVQAYVGADMLRVSAEQREAIMQYWGLNDPPLARYWNWLTAVASGDMGTSMIYRRPVLEVIGERFAASLALMGAAWLLSGLIGFTAGVLAAMNRNTRLDKLIRWYCYTLSSTPTFWVGLLLMLLFSVWLGWLPVGLAVPAGVTADHVQFIDRVRHMLLPALTLSVTGIAAIALHTREKLLDVMDKEYWLFAKARGEQGFTIFWRHGLRNVAMPAITLQFASFSELFGGAVLAEQVFSYPGLGQAAVEAGLRGDIPLLLGIVLFSAVFVYTGNTAADLIYRLIDPRMKAGRRS